MSLQEDLHDCFVFFACTNAAICVLKHVCVWGGGRGEGGGLGGVSHHISGHPREAQELE